MTQADLPDIEDCPKKLGGLCENCQQTACSRRSAPYKEGTGDVDNVNTYNIRSNGSSPVANAARIAQQGMQAQPEMYDGLPYGQVTNNPSKCCERVQVL